MRNEYFSMNTGVVRHERPTTRCYLSLEVTGVVMLLGNGKASVLDEQAQLATYITTQEDEARSRSVEKVVGSLLSQKPRTLCLHMWWFKIEAMLMSLWRSEGEYKQQLFDKISRDNALLRIGSTYPAMVIPSPCSSHTPRDCYCINMFLWNVLGPHLVAG